ncbi:DMT(drug/metabolite transporter) superfamily permease [Variovorax sp. CF313]|nr:DMT(drug/metabolite transporter) superfamily permease [Variovorax sp. CF313]
MSLSVGRWAVALVCLLPFAYGSIRRDWRAYWKHRGAVVGSSVVGIAAYNSVLYFGLRTTTASNALLLNSLAPLLIVVLGALLYRQRLQWHQGLGLFLSSVGVVNLVLQGRWSQWHAISFVPGDAIILGAAILWAVYTIWLRQLPSHLDRAGLMTIQIATALVVMLPFLLAEHRLDPGPDWELSAYAAVAYVGVFSSALAYFFYMRAVEHFGPARAGLCIHLAPMFGVVLSALFLHEKLQPYHAAGMSAIGAGLILSSVNWNGLEKPRWLSTSAET